MNYGTGGALLEDVEQLLQLGVTREKWLVSDQLICNLHQVRISIYVGVSYEAVHIEKQCRSSSKSYQKLSQ